MVLRCPLMVGAHEHKKAVVVDFLHSKMDKLVMKAYLYSS